MSSPMEVDPETFKPLDSQILQPPPLPLAAESPLDAFNKWMNEWSADGLWSLRIENAGDDREKQERVFADIVRVATEKLGILPRHTRQLIKDLDGDELKKLQEGVKAGVYKLDWAGLTKHRT